MMRWKRPFESLMQSPASLHVCTGSFRASARVATSSVMSPVGRFEDFRNVAETQLAHDIPERITRIFPLPICS
jgi:hypothetical protein